MERVPIQTYVMEYNEEMVREAISRELARGGQVYYVYNRVNNIEEITNQIRKLVPEASVAFAHGQMREQELERIMCDFIDGEIDVLVNNAGVGMLNALEGASREAIADLFATNTLGTIAMTQAVIATAVAVGALLLPPAAHPPAAGCGQSAPAAAPRQTAG